MARLGNHRRVADSLTAALPLILLVIGLAGAADCKAYFSGKNSNKKNLNDDEDEDGTEPGDGYTYQSACPVASWSPAFTAATADHATGLCENFAKCWETQSISAGDHVLYTPVDTQPVDVKGNPGEGNSSKGVSAAGAKAAVPGKGEVDAEPVKGKVVWVAKTALKAAVDGTKAAHEAIVFLPGKGKVKVDTTMLKKAPSLNENDHNYGTSFGQGNTYGLFCGKITIDNRHLDPEHRVGLFENNETLKVVARMSDFGADGGPVKLGRLALKMPWAAALDGEINWQFTSDMSVFAFRNLKSLIGGSVLDKLADLKWTLLYLWNTLSFG